MSAQDLFFVKNTKTIDSLIHYQVDYDLAESFTTSLYNQVSKSTTDKEVLKERLTLELYLATIAHEKKQYAKSTQLTLSIIDTAIEHQLHDILMKAYLHAALSYEYISDFESCKKYLDKAFELSNKSALHPQLANYYIRLSSYYRLNDKLEEAIASAQKAQQFAYTFNNIKDITDSHLLLGILLKNSDPTSSVKHSSTASRLFLQIKKYKASYTQYLNTAKTLIHYKEFDEAEKYIDTAELIKNNFLKEHHSHYFNIKSEFYKSQNNMDSAYANFVRFHTKKTEEIKEIENIEIQKITQEYNKRKAETTLQRKNQQLAFILIILAVMILATMLIINRNRKINSQNKTIHNQVVELTHNIEQKQILLSELQHRVKNNLQHVISILEIQKESINFNNIEELIKSNQNRIQSMALLHKKLTVHDNVNEIQLSKYIREIAELVIDSYENLDKKIDLIIDTKVDYLPITKASPIGLIIVELVSNSLKHAFKDTDQGQILIFMNKENNTYEFQYNDNGIGYDFYTVANTGLGKELITGLIDQLGGSIETTGIDGFEMRFYFS